MKLILILVALMLVGNASSEREYVNVNGFNVSFELFLPHEISTKSFDGLNGTLTIDAVGSSVNFLLTKYPKPRSLNSTWAKDSVDSLEYLGRPAELILIDGRQGVIALPTEGNHRYDVIYYPGLDAGKTSVCVGILSDLPFNLTADLLNSIHVVV